jgi:long-chain acyl-CoA synthetase
MLNLALILEQSTRRNPGKVAVILDDYRLRYAELNGAANKLANALVGMGVQPGDKVALMVPNTPHFPISYFGILKTGAAVVPLNVLFKQNEVQYHLEDSDAKALIVWEGFLGEALQGFLKAQTCHNLIVIQAPGSTAELPAGATGFNQIMADSAPTFDTVQTSPSDPAVISTPRARRGGPRGRSSRTSTCSSTPWSAPRSCSA